MEIVLILKYVSHALAFVLSACYFYQIVYLAAPFFKKPALHRAAVPNRYAVLIAARNEERVLPYLLDSLSAQDYPKSLFDVYVVADNCTDRTAETARLHGAEVFERSSATEIGKGYALNFLLRKLEESGKYGDYDAFLVFDADNLLRPDYITRINRVCSDGYDAFCGYRNSKNASQNWISSAYGLWYLHESVHLNQSRMQLGVMCAVSGTGFGFTRALLERCGGWNFFALTEDIEFDTWCAVNGARIGYCPEAMVYDEQPTSFRQAWRQRTRWVQGGLQVSVRYGTRLLRGMLRGGRTGYAAFEMTTLSLWGYGLSALAMGFALSYTFLSSRWTGVLSALGSSLLSTYLSMFVLGLLTTATEWRNIGGGASKKILHVFTFPLFMLTYVPVAVSAVFRKFQWQPIRHSVAVPVEQMVSPQ